MHNEVENQEPLTPIIKEDAISNQLEVIDNIPKKKPISIDILT
jgi:hypothetical protein